MDTMINATGFPAKEYDNEVTGKGVIPAEVTIAVKDKEVAQGLLEQRYEKDRGIRQRLQ